MGGRHPLRNVVVLLGAPEVWPQELQRLLDPDEWEFVLVADLEDLPTRLRDGAVQAVLMMPRSWSGRELLTLRECRALSPRTALVVMAENPVEPALKRAFEHGATSFLRWPASPEAVLQAISSGRAEEMPAAPSHRGIR
jgi:DNA-binding NarL/FixJ family response regulator